ncbi:MAG: hypothetical protein NTV52_05220, partial [Acidobacteria bacterium]|nr:hypothetical protein [Acidobacteriota bacterium]
SIQNAPVDAKHNYNRESREAVYRFSTSTFAPTNSLCTRCRRNTPSSTLIRVYSCPPSRPSSTPATMSRSLRPGARPRAAKAKSLSADELRALIRAQIGAKWPDQVVVVRAGAEILLQRAGSGVSIVVD